VQRAELTHRQVPVQMASAVGPIGYAARVIHRSVNYDAGSRSLKPQVETCPTTLACSLPN
jgi:hypothetical protein